MAPAGYLADKFSSKSVLTYSFALSITLFYSFWYFDQIDSPLYFDFTLLLRSLNRSIKSGLRRIRKQVGP